MHLSMKTAPSYSPMTTQTQQPLQQVTIKTVSAKVAGYIITIGTCSTTHTIDSDFRLPTAALLQSLH